MNKVALVLRGTAFLLDFAVCVLAIMYFCAAAAILCSFDGFDGVPKAPQREPVAENWLFPLSVVIWFAARDAFSRRGLPSFLRLFGFRQLVSARTQIGTMALAVARSSLFFAVPLLLVAYSTSGLGLWQTLFGIFAIPVSVASTTNGRGLHDLASGTTCTRSVTVATGQQEPTRWLRSVGSVLIWFAVSGALSLGLQLAAPRFFARYNAAVEEIVGQSKRLSVLTRDEQETLRLTNTGAGFYIENRSPTLVLALQESGVDRSFVERVRNETIEWGVRIKILEETVTSESKKLQVPAGTPFLDAQIWMTTGIPEDHGGSVAVSVAVSRYLLIRNPEVGAIRISLGRGARVGPIQAVENRTMWITVDGFFTPRDEFLKRYLLFNLTLPPWVHWPPYVWWR